MKTYCDSPRCLNLADYRLSIEAKGVLGREVNYLCKECFLELDKRKVAIENIKSFFDGELDLVIAKRRAHELA